MFTQKEIACLCCCFQIGAEFWLGDFRIFRLCKIQCSTQCLLSEHGPLQCEAPDRGHLTNFFTNYPPISCANLIDSHACLQSSHGSKLNTVAWIVELTHLHVVVKCENLSSVHDKTHCIVSFPVFRFLRSSNSRICAGNCTVRVKDGLLCLQAIYYGLFIAAIINERKPEKIQARTGPWPLRYRCSAPWVELSSPLGADDWTIKYEFFQAFFRYLLSSVNNSCDEKTRLCFVRSSNHLLS